MEHDELERIRARAYELWEQAGRPEGRDSEHWLEAERELSGQPRTSHEGISDHPVKEEEERQEALPPRGQSNSKSQKPFASPEEANREAL